MSNLLVGLRHHRILVHPIEPQFLAAIAERTASRNVVFSAETLRGASKDFKISGIEGS